MPAKSQARKRDPVESPRRLKPRYAVLVPRLKPIFRVWVNPADTDNILTFAIMFGEGNVKLLPSPREGIIALESGCEYRVNPNIPVGYVYVPWTSCLCQLGTKVNQI
jgi:hypothetical protein